MRYFLRRNSGLWGALAALLAATSCDAGMVEDVDGMEFASPAEADVGHSPCDVGDRADAGADDRDCYALFSEPTTWADARATCASLGPDFHLATVTGPDEARRVAQLAGDIETWLGGNDTARDGRWSWVTGEPVDYEIWEPGLPDDVDDADCLAVRGVDGLGVWFDRACSDSKAFVCERG